MIEQRGHVLECRINAEHPEKFTPSAGKITAFHTPGEIGVRVDTAMYAEAVVPPYYDSLIAKLIVRGKDRAEAIARMSRALDMFIVEGIHTSIPLHRRIMKDPEFMAGRIDTKFMERFLARREREASNRQLIARRLRRRRRDRKRRSPLTPARGQRDARKTRPGARIAWSRERPAPARFRDHSNCRRLYAILDIDCVLQRLPKRRRPNPAR